MSEQVTNVGWGWPGLAGKAHFFSGGRSLCGKWAFSGQLQGVDAGGPDDCAECRRRLAKDANAATRATKREVQS